MECEIKEWFEVFRGDDIKAEIALTDCTTGDILDISNCIVGFTIKNKMSDLNENAILKKDIIEHYDPTNWITFLELSREETNIEPWVYHFDFKLLDVYAKRTTLVVWQFVVKNVVNNF